MDATEVATPDQEEQTLSQDEVFENRRRHQAITAHGEPVHEDCCGCVEFYHGCNGQPEGKPFQCRDYRRLPDVMPGVPLPPFPASRMQGRTEPRVRREPATDDQDRPISHTPARAQATVLPGGVRVCGCGAVLLKGKRLCDQCRTQNKRQTMREYMRQRRGSGAVDAGSGTRPRGNGAMVLPGGGDDLP